MPSKKETKHKNTQALRRWARYRAEQAAAQGRGETIVKQAKFAKGKDRLWSVKSESGGRKIAKAGFRTKKGAKDWLKAQAHAYVRSQNAKALSALPARDKTIAKAFEKLAGGDD